MNLRTSSLRVWRLFAFWGVGVVLVWVGVSPMIEVAIPLVALPS